MNKQEYLIITFHSLDGMCFSCQNKDMEKWKIFLEENQIHYEKIVKVVF